MPYLYYNIVFVVYCYVNNMNGVPTPNSSYVKLPNILCKSRPSKPSPTGEVIVDLHLYHARWKASVLLAKYPGGIYSGGNICLRSHT